MYATRFSKAIRTLNIFITHLSQIDTHLTKTPFSMPHHHCWPVDRSTFWRWPLTGVDHHWPALTGQLSGIDWQIHHICWPVNFSTLTNRYTISVDIYTISKTFQRWPVNFLALTNRCTISVTSCLAYLLIDIPYLSVLWYQICN